MLGGFRAVVLWRFESLGLMFKVLRSKALCLGPKIWPPFCPRIHQIPLSLTVIVSWVLLAATPILPPQIPP